MKPSLFPIGKAADICSVSTRTLRYYEENGLVVPDYVDADNKYRYYSYETLLRVQTIRYLLDEGFPLSEIHELLRKDDLDTMHSRFLEQIKQTESEIRHLKQRLASLNAWQALLAEGKHVLNHDSQTVHTRFLPEHTCFFYHHLPENEEEKTTAFLETTYYTEYKRNGNDMVDMGGSINVHYESFEDRMHANVRSVTLLQTMYPDSQNQENTMLFGGFLAACCYHIGSRDNITDTYSKILDWCRKHHFELRGDSLERHVLDGYSVSKEEHYVTEILLPIAEEFPVGASQDW